MSSKGKSHWRFLGIALMLLMAGSATLAVPLLLGTIVSRYFLHEKQAPVATAPVTLPQAPVQRHHGAPSEPSPPLQLPESQGYAASEDSLATLPLEPEIPIWGGDRALVTVLLFGDLNCPFTRHMFRTLGHLKGEMPLDLRLAWRHRPTTPSGENLANFAARLHETHGAASFWRFVDVVSRRSGQLELRQVPDLAEELGLTRADLLKLVSAKATSKQVSEDLELAIRYGIRRTPTLFIDGFRVEGLVRREVLREVIEAERRAQVSALTQGVTHPALYSTRVANTFVNLGIEPPVRRCVPLGNAPARGAHDPEVTIVVFSEFQCRFCAQMRFTLDALLKAFGKKTRVAWRNFPLDDHPEARAAANLAMHATQEADPETFWKVHNALFDAHASLGTATYGAILERLKLDKDVYLSKVEAREYDVEIDRDIELGHQLGVTSVPTTFINGRRVEGARDLLTMTGLVAEELENMRHLSTAGYAPERLEETLCQAH